jgi:hypothetical protein
VQDSDVRDQRQPRNDDKQYVRRCRAVASFAPRAAERRDVPHGPDGGGDPPRYVEVSRADACVADGFEDAGNGQQGEDGEDSRGPQSHPDPNAQHPNEHRGLHQEPGEHRGGHHDAREQPRRNDLGDEERGVGHEHRPENQELRRVAHVGVGSGELPSAAATDHKV